MTILDKIFGAPRPSSSELEDERAPEGEVRGQGPASRQDASAQAAPSANAGGDEGPPWIQQVNARLGQLDQEQGRLLLKMEQLAVSTSQAFQHLTDPNLGLNLVVTDQRHLARSMERLAASVDQIQKQRDVLGRLQDENRRLQVRSDELLEVNGQLRRERDEADRRLNEALSRLATKDKSYHTTSAVGVPSQEMLLRKLERLRNQDLQGLSQAIYSQSRQTNEEIGNGDRRKVLAQIRSVLAAVFLVEAYRWVSELVAIRSEDLPVLEREILRSAQQGLRLGGSLGPELASVASQCLDLVHQMLGASPPARLLFPRPGTAFNPEWHEILPGCPVDGPLQVGLTVFPGCWVSPPPRVLQRALVVTHQSNRDPSEADLM